MPGRQRGRDRQRHHRRPLRLQRHRRPVLGASVQRRAGQHQLRQVPRRHRLRRLRHPGADLVLRRHLQPAVEHSVRRRLLAVFAAAALMIGLGMAVAHEARAATTGPITGYQGLCLDDRSASTANGNPIQVYTCNGTTAQQWTVAAGNTLQVLGDVPGRHRGRHGQRHPGRPVHLQRHRRPGLGTAVERRAGQPQLGQVPRRHRLRRLRHPGPDLGLRRHRQPAMGPAQRGAHGRAVRRDGGGGAGHGLRGQLRHRRAGRGLQRHRPPTAAPTATGPTASTSRPPPTPRTTPGPARTTWAGRRPRSGSSTRSTWPPRAPTP